MDGERAKGAEVEEEEGKGEGLELAVLEFDRNVNYPFSLKCNGLSRFTFEGLVAFCNVF